MGVELGAWSMGEAEIWTTSTPVSADFSSSQQHCVAGTRRRRFQFKVLVQNQLKPVHSVLVSVLHLTKPVQTDYVFFFFFKVI